MRFITALATVFMAISFMSGKSQAHEIRPAIVTLTINADRQFEVVISTNLEVLIAGVGAKVKNTNSSPKADQYNNLRALSADELRAKFQAFAPGWRKGIAVTFGAKRARLNLSSLDIPGVGDVELARISKVHLKGVVPRGAQTVAWVYDGKYGSSVLRVIRPGQPKPVTAWLKDGAPSAAIPLSGLIEKSTASLLYDYVAIGFVHIVPRGIDHILFVLGLYLLSAQLRPLLTQVTAFTLAHSITLALGVYGVVEISPKIVEPLIALSIVYVAVENVVLARLSPWRPFVIFAFGLLHGLGFAGVLREIGLPRADFVTGLVGFNLGVEFGQLAVITAAFLATGLWFRNREWYHARIVVPGSLAIAAVGLYWSVERLFFV